MAGFNRTRQEVYDRVSRSQYYRDNLAGLNAHERHQQLISAALSYNGPPGSNSSSSHDLASIKTDEDVLRERHRFLRTAEDDAEASWEVRLARRYYDRLFKEFAIVDLSHYKQQQLGLRWRTQAEVVSGKGQLICATKGCNEQRGLCSYEVNFVYREAGQTKQALVKLRVCPDCAYKLNYGRKKHYKKVERKREGSKRERKAAAGRADGEDAVRLAMGSGQGGEGQGEEERHHRKKKERHSCNHSAEAAREAAAAAVAPAGGQARGDHGGLEGGRVVSGRVMEGSSEMELRERRPGHGVGNSKAPGSSTQSQDEQQQCQQEQLEGNSGPNTEGQQQQRQQQETEGDGGTGGSSLAPPAAAAVAAGAAAGLAGAAAAAAAVTGADPGITDQDIETFLDEVFAT